MIQPVYLLFIVFVLCVVGLALQPPLAQNPAYHQFADVRMYWGIPNFWNVVSNLPFLIVGGWGLWHCSQRGFPSRTTQYMSWTLCFGIFIVSLGSGYYHATPNHQSLVWDRLPMTFMFMSLFSMLLYDFIGQRMGEYTFWIAVPLGVWSVLYWQYSETLGRGDLRPYAFVQFFPMIASTVLVAFFPKKVPYTRLLGMILGIYALAKAAEHFDKPIFDSLHFWSGHTIKHLLSAWSLIYAVRFMQQWARTSFSSMSI